MNVTKADKGNTTVIIKTNDYINKNPNFINSNGYVRLPKNPINKYQTEI